MKQLSKKMMVVMLMGVTLMMGQFKMKGQNHVVKNTELNKNTAMMNTVLHLKIKGMHCQEGCANGIDAMLKEREGIIKSETSFDESSSVIEYDSKLISEETILNLIKERGFEVVVIAEKENSTSH